MMSSGTPRRGVFISFEGIDGTGKTTQAALLARWLRERGLVVVHTREPGGTPLGEELRRLLLDMKGEGAEADGRGPVPVAEMLLMAAARAQHVARVILPALEAGQVVVSDRYVDSSLAYQGAGLGLPEQDVRLVNEVATGGLLPDLTILLDLEPARAHEREGVALDRIERRGLAFQERVRNAYHRLARQEPGRWLVLDVAGMSVDAVHAQVARAVAARLRERGLEP
ncbi:MAG: dTMP kinase [Limnochordales bacterium]